MQPIEYDGPPPRWAYDSAEDLPPFFQPDDEDDIPPNAGSAS